MFLRDIELVTEKVKQYGLKKPFADLGGLARPTIADYAITLRGGSQHDRYITLHNGARPFDHIDPAYQIFNPENGDDDIEAMAFEGHYEFGTIVCLNVIEHVVNPFKVFEAIYDLTAPGGLVIITTVWSFPTHAAPRDFWRLSPECLDMLGKYARFEVLETGFHLVILADAGIKEIHSGEPQEVRADYVVLRKL